jgi:hypothetical protein
VKNIVLRLKRSDNDRSVEKLTYEVFRNAEHADGKFHVTTDSGPRVYRRKRVFVCFAALK